MKNSWKKKIAIVLCITGILVLGTLTGFAANDPITIVIVGDSTACNYDASRAPRMGWGQTLDRFFNDQVTIRNHASSGRSSKSFISEGKMDRALADLKAGDYLLIQFGHNDSKRDDQARYTEPFTTYKETLTKYVVGAQEKGANPILITPIERRSFSGSTAKTSHGQYPAAMRELAAQLEIPLVDLTTISIALYNEAGPEGTKDLFLFLNPGEHKNYPEGITDNTHLQEAGAVKICELFASDLQKQALPLAAYLK